MILIQKLTTHRVQIDAVLKVLTTNKEIDGEKITEFLLTLDDVLIACLNPR